MLQFLLEYIDWVAIGGGILVFLVFIRAARGSGQQKVIMMACQWGDEKAVRNYLCDAAWMAKATDANGMTPLHVAALWGHVGIAEMLLRHRAEVNACNKAGMTPLHGAAMAGHEDVVAFLAQHGADTNARDTLGNTPLHFAVWDGHAADRDGQKSVSVWQTLKLER